MENYNKVGAVYKPVEDDSVIDLKSYKEAKVHLENLEHISKVLDLATRGLNNFKVYTPAHDTILYLQGQQLMVDAYIKKCKKVLKKGK